MIGLRLWQLAGWTMLHYLWVGALLGAAALLVRHRLRSTPANVRYLVALVSLLLLSVAPAAIALVVIEQLGPETPSVLPLVDSADRAEAVPPVAIRPTTLPTGASVSAATSPALHESDRERLPSPLELLATWLPWLWVFGAPLSFVLTTAGLLGAERLRRQSRPLEDARISELCRRLAVSLRISHRVGVAVCDRIVSPILVGVFRPLILLPAAALAGWDPQQLEMVLLHELAHVRRYDNLVNLLQRVVESLLFFQPLVWIISDWVRREREHCCDEIVVARTQQPQAYAEILAALAEKIAPRSLRGSSLAHPGAISSMAERPVLARIRRILKKEEQAMQVSRKAVGVGFIGVLILAVTIGGYYSLPSFAEDSTAATNGTSADAPRSDAVADPTAKVSAEKREARHNEAVSLDQAIATFNRKLSVCRFDVERPRQPALAREQIPAPLTVEEVVTAIRGWDRKRYPVADETYARFAKIARTKMLPPSTQGFRIFDQWCVDRKDNKYEDRTWRIDLDVMTGRDTGYTFPVRELKLGRRMALLATPGYSWIVEPHANLGPAGYSWGGCVFYVDRDKDGALTVVVSRVGEGKLPALQVIAFDDHARRYEFTRHDVGSHTIASRVRIDAAIPFGPR